MTVRVASGNPLLDNIDMNKQETKLQKDINSSVKQNRDKMNEEEKAKADADEAAAKAA